jgi:hypothetical protein
MTGDLRPAASSCQEAGFEILKTQNIKQARGLRQLAGVRQEIYVLLIRDFAGTSDVFGRAVKTLLTNCAKSESAAETQVRAMIMLFCSQHIPDWHFE